MILKILKKRDIEYKNNSLSIYHHKLLFLLLLSLFILNNIILAAPQDVIVTDYNNKVFFCSQYSEQYQVDTKSNKIISTNDLARFNYNFPLNLDYCDIMKSESNINKKHYSSIDNNLSLLCDSKSVYRIISKVDFNPDGSCTVAKDNIKWYCDDSSNILDYSLPKDSLYCPYELPFIRCPHNSIKAEDKIILSDYIYNNPVYCDFIEIGEKHYVTQDQILAKFTDAEIKNLKFQNINYAKDLINCPSKSAYRVIKSKKPKDKLGFCEVSYDVYCEAEIFVDKTPSDRKYCPKPEVQTIVKQNIQETNTINQITSKYKSKSKHCSRCGCNQFLYMMPCNNDLDNSKCNNSCCNSDCDSDSDSDSDSVCSNNSDDKIYEQEVTTTNTYSSDITKTNSDDIIVIDGIKYKYNAYTGYYLPIN